MADLPTGTVTFLTDIEGSVEMWERNAPAMQWPSPATR